MVGLLQHTSARTRILSFALFLVLLPGAVLSYLGFRSINEKAENLAASYHGTVILIRDRIEAEIRGLDETLRSSVSAHPLRSSTPDDVRRWLSGLGAEHPGLGHFFLMNSRGGVLSGALSFGWAQEENEPELGIIIQTPEFRSAEMSEYVRKDYAAALQSYRGVLARARTSAGRGMVLSRIGRCYFKMNRYREGIAEYRNILALPAQLAGSHVVPLSVVALSQIADGYASLRKEKERKDALLALYEHLLRHPWDLEGGDYIYYLGSTAREIDAILKGSSHTTTTQRRIMELQGRERELLEEVELVQVIHHNLTPQLPPEMSREAVPGSSPMRIALSLHGSQSDVTCLRLPPSFQQLGISTLGYLNNEEYIISALIPRVLGSVDLGRDLVVGILDPLGTPRYLQNKVSTSQSLMAEGFSKVLSLWKVALFHPEGKTIEELVSREKNIYLAIFVGIVTVMALGIVVIGRAALHEAKASRMRSDFVASVSHELKTPLALIRMFGETLASGLVSEEAKRQEFYRIITKESERLTHLINNVLDFSKMETGNKRYHFEEDDIVQVVGSTLEAYRFHIRDLGFDLAIALPDEPIVMLIDKDAVSQALLNLLNNAAKYSKDRKYIRVALTKSEDRVSISVEDRGVGIPQEELTKVFDKFYRARTARTQETTGSGLGLALVKHIIEAHEGTVDVNSVVGEGSTFVLRLPVRHISDT